MTELFLRILNMSITAGWIVLAVLLVRFLLRKAPKWISCLLWALVALRLVLPVSLESVFSMIPSPEVFPQDIVTTVTPQIQSGIPAVNDALNPVIAQQGSGPVKEILSLASRLWLSGMGLMLLYSAVSYLRLRRQVRQSLREQSNIYICDYVGSPFILGVIRSRIYLPSGMEEDQRQYVLAHENAHLRRWDHLWKPMGFLLLSIYWFNPLLWVAYVLLCRDIEQACDEKVIAPMDTAHKKGYSEALVACSVPRRTIMACPVAFGELGVKARIRGVLSYKKPAFWIMLVSVAACCVIALCFLTNPKPCQHTYESRITLEAACNQMGVEAFTCSRCGYYYNEPVALLAHTYEADAVVTEPSCTEPGSMEYRCTGCGIRKTEALEKIAHTPGQLTVQKLPNCKETGIRTAQCTRCSQVCVTETMAVNDAHNMQQTDLRPATCSEPGESISTCTRCGHTESTELPKLEHDYIAAGLLDADCSTQAQKQKICINCGDEQRTILFGRQKDHTWVQISFYLPEQCAVCGETRPNNKPLLSEDEHDDLFKPRFPQNSPPETEVIP